MATTEDLTKPPEATGLLTKAAEIKPMTVAAPTTTPDGMTQQNAGSVTTAGQTYSPTTFTQTVDPTKTTQGLLSQVMDKNGELMRIASQRGYNQANRRGMGNSSVAAQASMGAMIDAAMPIAQADASIYQQQALNNQQAMNSAATALNQVQDADMRSRLEVETTRATDAIKQSTIGEEYRNKFVSQYMEAVANVLNNKDMSPAQMQASINRMYENLQGSVALQASIEGVDFAQYKPGAATGSNQTTTDAVNAAFGNSGAAQVLALPADAKAALKARLDGEISALTGGGRSGGRGAPQLSGGAYVVNNRGHTILSTAEADRILASLSKAEKQWVMENLDTPIADGTPLRSLFNNATGIQ